MILEGICYLCPTGTTVTGEDDIFQALLSKGSSNQLKLRDSIDK
jgi:hypothetical protein